MCGNKEHSVTTSYFNHQPSAAQPFFPFFLTALFLASCLCHPLPPPPQLLLLSPCVKSFLMAVSPPPREPAGGFWLHSISSLPLFSLPLHEHFSQRFFKFRESQDEGYSVGPVSLSEVWEKCACVCVCVREREMSGFEGFIVVFSLPRGLHVFLMLLS